MRKKVIFKGIALPYLLLLPQLAITAVYSRDIPVIQGVVLVVTGVVIVTNLVVDILYTLLNPKVRPQ